MLLLMSTWRSLVHHRTSMTKLLQASTHGPTVLKTCLDTLLNIWEIQEIHGQDTLLEIRLNWLEPPTPMPTTTLEIKVHLPTLKVVLIEIKEILLGGLTRCFSLVPTSMLATCGDTSIYLHPSTLSTALLSIISFASCLELVMSLVRCMLQIVEGKLFWESKVLPERMESMESKSITVLMPLLLLLQPFKSHLSVQLPSLQFQWLLQLLQMSLRSSIIQTLYIKDQLNPIHRLVSLLHLILS